MINAFGGAIIIEVAESAIGIEAPEKSNRGAFMAAFALNGLVGAYERKSVKVSVNFLGNFKPPPHAVALLAVASQLTPVNIRVAIGALGSAFGKIKLDVAFFAAKPRMQTDKRIPRFLMVKIGSRAHRLPAFRGVTVLAWNLE